MAKYVIGIDFGTLSARALLVELESGREVAVSESVYAHAILKEVGGVALPNNFALQDPQDYLDALKTTVNQLITKNKVDYLDVIGLGIDFTTCTMLPVDKDLNPLCFKEEFKSDPHAYAKLWKHHGGEKEADLIEQTALRRGEKWLKRYGGKVSSEYFFPKMLETFNKSRAVFDNTYCFIEAGDWLVSLLVGKIVKSNCLAGYKALWSKTDGYPTKDFWAEISPQFADKVQEKTVGEILSVGTKAGEITAFGQRLTGLNQGTAVAVAVGDAHSALPSANVTSGGKMMLILGTSACQIVLDKKDVSIDGICGSVVDGIIPEYVSYEAGQTCFGDAFDWVVKNTVPQSYYKEAEKLGQSIFDFITKKADELKVGESGLLALDWFNGNRNPYFDFSLSGAILGLTLSTKPEHIYRAVVEANAYCAKRIMDLYKDNGIVVNEIVAGGGIANKSPFVMQILADVIGTKISVVDSKQAGAKGSCIYAAAASGYYGGVKQAADAIADRCTAEYFPNKENTEKYAKLYKEYAELSEYFARENDLLKRIKNI